MNIAPSNVLNEQAKPSFFINTKQLHWCSEIPVSGLDDHYYQPEGSHKVLGLLVYLDVSDSDTGTRTVFYSFDKFLEGYLLDVTELVIAQQIGSIAASVIIEYNSSYYEIPTKLTVLNKSGPVNFSEIDFSVMSKQVDPLIYNFVQEVKVTAGSLTPVNSGKGQKFDLVDLEEVSTAEFILSTVLEPIVAEPTNVDDLLVVVNNFGSSPVEYTESPTPTIFVYSGEYTFNLKTQGGKELTISSVTNSDPSATTDAPTVPFTINGENTILRTTGYSPNDITITHNGNNSPFVIKVYISP